MSDLHLEVGKQYSSFDFPVSAPYLILAGDIGCLVDYELYLEFLRIQCERYERVFLVLGNHEFYGLSRDEGLRRAEALVKESVLRGRLSLLNRSRVDLELHPDITILGCTLNSHITPETRSVVAMKVQDFRKINGWSIDDHNAEHMKDVEWLKQEVSRIRNEYLDSGKEILVVTHHAPCTQNTSSPADTVSAWSTAFSTDLLQESSLTGVQCWIFGHTHYTTDVMKSGVRVISNQRGYVLPSCQNNTQPAKSIWQQAASLFAKPVGDNRFVFDSRKTLSL